MLCYHPHTDGVEVAAGIDLEAVEKICVEERPEGLQERAALAEEDSSEESVAPLELSHDVMGDESLQRHRDSVSTLGWTSSSVSQASQVMELQGGSQESPRVATTAAMGTATTTTPAVATATAPNAAVVVVSTSSRKKSVEVRKSHLECQLCVHFMEVSVHILWRFNLLSCYVFDCSHLILTLHHWQVEGKYVHSKC